MRIVGACHRLEGILLPSYAQRSPAAARSSRPERRNASGTTTPRPNHGSLTREFARQDRSSVGHRSTRPVRSAVRALFDDVPITVIDADNLPSFAELGLDQQLTQALSRSGIETPFPVQAATIPDAVAGRDVLGRASTGSGKTLAFGLPMISRLAGETSLPRQPRGLVLVPTRELAMQVCDALAPLAQVSRLSLRLIAGGLPIQKQIQGLARGADIIVATPGRLIDLLERRACDLSEIKVTVLDEADHMADLGFLPVVRQLLDLTPAHGQRLLFSATLDGDVASLVAQYLVDPVIKALAPAVATIDAMAHYVFRVPASLKLQVITEIAAREDRTILFVRTKHGAERLADNLNRSGVPAGALHGGRSQGQRTRALSRFKDGSVPALVATDVAARGIHVDDVSLVVHVDPPADAKDYLHRSGRTARAGESGVVVTIVTPNEDRSVRTLLSAAGVRPTQREVAPGDRDLVAVTGARAPSGVPVVEIAHRSDALRREPRVGSHGQTRRGPRGLDKPRRGEVGVLHPAQAMRGGGTNTRRGEVRPVRPVRPVQPTSGNGARTGDRSSAASGAARTHG